MTWVEGISIAKDLIVAVAAITTGGAAIYGVRKWRLELEGKAAFDTARALIRSTYKLRDSVRSCRSPMFMAAEFPEDFDRAKAAPTQRADAWSHAFTTRWKYVLDALQEFDADSLEAEAIWGNVIRTQTDQLRACAVELKVAMEAIVSDHRSDGGEFRSDEEFAKNMRGRASAIDGDSDPLSVKIRTTITGIEKAVVPHLRRK